MSVDCNINIFFKNLQLWVSSWTEKLALQASQSIINNGNGTNDVKWFSLRLACLQCACPSCSFWQVFPPTPSALPDTLTKLLTCDSYDWRSNTFHTIFIEQSWQKNIWNHNQKDTGTMKSEKMIRLDWIVQCFTSPPTQYRLYGRRFLQVKRPNQQYQSTEGSYKGKQHKKHRKHKIHMHRHTIK